MGFGLIPFFQGVELGGLRIFIRTHMLSIVEQHQVVLKIMRCNVMLLGISRIVSASTN